MNLFSDGFANLWSTHRLGSEALAASDEKQQSCWLGSPGRWIRAAPRQSTEQRDSELCRWIKCSSTRPPWLRPLRSSVSASQAPYYSELEGPELSAQSRSRGTVEILKQNDQNEAH